MVQPAIVIVTHHEERALVPRVQVARIAAGASTPAAVQVGNVDVSVRGGCLVVQEIHGGIDILEVSTFAIIVRWMLARGDALLDRRQ